MFVADCRLYLSFLCVYFEINSLQNKFFHVFLHTYVCIHTYSLILFVLMKILYQTNKDIKNFLGSYIRSYIFQIGIGKLLKMAKASFVFSSFQGQDFEIS
jgi:hypothetical protein